MTRDDIIRMAQEAGAERNSDFPDWSFEDEDLERFAALVLAKHPPQSSMAWQEGFEAGRLAEREACADECVRLAIGGGFAADCAAAIRARGQA